MGNRCLWPAPATFLTQPGGVRDGSKLYDFLHDLLTVLWRKLIDLLSWCRQINQTLQLP